MEASRHLSGTCLLLPLATAQHSGRAVARHDVASFAEAVAVVEPFTSTSGALGRRRRGRRFGAFRARRVGRKKKRRTRRSGRVQAGSFRQSVRRGAGVTQKTSGPQAMRRLPWRPRGRARRTNPLLPSRARSVQVGRLAVESVLTRALFKAERPRQEVFSTSGARSSTEPSRGARAEARGSARASARSHRRPPKQKRLAPHRRAEHSAAPATRAR